MKSWWSSLLVHRLVFSTSINAAAHKMMRALDETHCHLRQGILKHLRVEDEGKYKVELAGDRRRVNSMGNRQDQPRC